MIQASLDEDITDETVDSFRVIWNEATPEAKREIYEIVWRDVEDACRKAKKIPPCPSTKIVDLYHEKLPELRACVKLTNNRKGFIRARWKEFPDLSLWRQYFERVRKSDWLMGRCQPAPGRRVFAADIDYLINEQNMIQIIEGKYDK